MVGAEQEKSLEKAKALVNMKILYFDFTHM
jgi:hypothetical protein